MMHAIPIEIGIKNLKIAKSSEFRLLIHCFCQVVVVGLEDE